MELTKSFPPTDDLFTYLAEIDYKKQLNRYMDGVVNICAFIAAIATVLYNLLSNMKFSTPESIADYFYFAVNFKGDSEDEIIGFSIMNRYIGMYPGTIQWGVLDENGAL